MPGAGLTLKDYRKVPSDMPAFKPYWGKPAVRNFRGGDGNVGIIRSPLRAIALPDRPIKNPLKKEEVSDLIFKEHKESDVFVFAASGLRVCNSQLDRGNFWGVCRISNRWI